MPFQLKHPAVYIRRWFLLVLLILVSPFGQAQQLSCQDAFPSAVSSAQTTSVVRILRESRVTTPGDLVVTTRLENSTNTCGARNCVATNSVAPDNNGAFNQFPGGANINVSAGATRHLPPGNYNNLTLDNQILWARATLVLQPGIYTFAGNFSAGTGSIVRLEGPGGSAVYVRGAVEIGNNATVNTAGSSPPLFFFTRGNVTLARASDVRSYVYAHGTVRLDGEATLRGAITARGDITLDYVTIIWLILYRGSNVEYDASGLADGEFGTFCRAGSAITLSNFVVSVPPSGSTCQPITVSISAMDSLGNLMTGYTGAITVSTSTGRGDWSKTDTPADALGSLATGPPNSGSATYTFDSNGNDAGTALLRLSNSHAGPLTVTVNDTDGGTMAVSTPVTFSANGFVFTPTDTLGSDVVAGRNHAFQVQMVRRDPSTGVCGVATNYNRATVRAWLVRATGDPGGAAPRLVNSSAVATNLPGSMPAADNFPANFTSGVANVSLSTSDVGRYRLELADQSGTFSSIPILGSSTEITARPFALDVRVENPGASSATGAVFQAAGAPFAASVRAVAWQADDDKNGDGVADGHADNDTSSKAVLTNNASVLSFGRENPAAAVLLRSALLLPVGGADPGLGSTAAAPADGRKITGFSSGTGSTSSIYFDEAGIIELRAKIDGGNYLGTATAIDRTVGRSGFVGRFVPNRFTLSVPSVRAACESVLPYSYMGEPFNLRFSLTARSTRGSVLRNYMGSFAKLTDSTGTLSLFGRDAGAGVTLQERLALGERSFNWAAGVASGDAVIRVERTTAPDGPYRQLRLGLLPMDDDGVTIAVADRNFDGNGDGTNDAVAIGQTDVRFGRFVLDDAFGPETATLAVGMRTEYWEGNVWRLNRDDSCTTLSLNSIRYPSGPITVATNRTVPVGAGSTRGEYATINASGVKFSAGDAGHFFTAPGMGNTGSFRVNVLLQDRPWLRFDWNGDSDHGDTATPFATYTFGIYRGHDRVIHWREVLR